MGVNLKMKLGTKTFDLGRAHNFIDAMQGGQLNLTPRDLYDELFSCREDLAKRINALAAHHPTHEELNDIYEEVEHMLMDFTSDAVRLGRCLMLATFKEEYDAKFEVQ